MKKTIKDAKPGERVYGFGKGIFARKREDGAIQYGIAYTHDGKRYREIIGETITLARKMLAKRQTEINDGKFFPIAAKAPAFDEFAKEYLAYARDHKRSFRRDEEIVEKLVAFFASKSLDDISRVEVERYKVQSVRTVQKATVNREVAILRRMFNYAGELGRFDKRNPAGGKGVMYREDERPIEPLTDAQQDALLAACAPHIRAIVEFGLNTGLRRGEILALEWSSVDLVRGHLTVQRSKSGRVRHVPLNGPVRELLRGLEGPRQGPVFRYRGEPIRNNFNRSFRRACRDAGLERIVVNEYGRRENWPRFHDLRHTFATDLSNGGVGIRDVQELLGHASVTTTQRYEHPTTESKRRAVDSLVRPASEVRPNVAQRSHLDDDKTEVA